MSFEHFVMPQAKANEQDIMKLLACLSDLDNLCRRCAVELDLHIGEIYVSDKILSYCHTL